LALCFTVLGEDYCIVGCAITLFLAAIGGRWLATYPWPVLTSALAIGFLVTLGLYLKSPNLIIVENQTGERIGWICVTYGGRMTGWMHIPNKAVVEYRFRGLFFDGTIQVNGGSRYGDDTEFTARTSDLRTPYRGKTRVRITEGKLVTITRD
jgi:hypothetical protein